MLTQCSLYEIKIRNFNLSVKTSMRLCSSGPLLSNDILVYDGNYPTLGEKRKEKIW